MELIQLEQRRCFEAFYEEYTLYLVLVFYAVKSFFCNVFIFAVLQIQDLAKISIFVD